MAKTILVVDDSVTMVLSLKTTLALNGFQAETAGNGREALAARSIPGRRGSGVPAGTVKFAVTNEKYSPDDDGLYRLDALPHAAPGQSDDPAQGNPRAAQQYAQFRLLHSRSGSAVAQTLTHAWEAIVVSNIHLIYLWIRFQRLSYGVAAWWP